MGLLKNIQKYSDKISIIIVGHHFYKHFNDNDLTFVEKFVQYDDINNHETIALFFLGIYLGPRLI